MGLSSNHWVEQTKTGVLTAEQTEAKGHPNLRSSDRGRLPHLRPLERTQKDRQEFAQEEVQEGGEGCNP